MKNSFKNMHTIPLNGICDTMNSLFEAGSFGALSTYVSASDRWYILNFFPLHTKFNMKLSLMDRL